MVTLSEQELIDCDRGGYDAGCDGGGYPTGVEYIIKHGITTDAEYPYVARDDTCDRKIASKYVQTWCCLFLLFLCVCVCGCVCVCVCVCVYVVWGRS